jgi:ABC-type lipoprotein release transport system permease subunit
VLATVGFAGASLLACLIPSARAAAADPLTLLRME